MFWKQRSQQKSGRVGRGSNCTVEADILAPDRSSLSRIDDRPFDDRLKLAHVAGPTVVCQDCQGFS
jgi:hypothetical protein